jgi:hypothetical protein
MMQLNEFLHVCQECVAEKRDRCHAAIISQAGLKTIQIKALPKILAAFSKPGQIYLPNYESTSFLHLH